MFVNQSMTESSPKALAVAVADRPQLPARLADAVLFLTLIVGAALTAAGIALAVGFALALSALVGLFSRTAPAGGWRTAAPR